MRISRRVLPDLFQSTLPTRGSDVYTQLALPCDKIISIHAPHEGERRRIASYLPPEAGISIHAPHEGERLYFASHY